MTERDIIKQFISSGGHPRKDLVRGIGDDCAVLRLNKEKLWLVTTDTLVESVHFDLGWHPPELLGRKAVAVNISDIAAMGGQPAFAFLSLGMPREFSSEWLGGFANGLKQACRDYRCNLAGGDTVQTTQGITITLTVIGEVQANQVLYRNTASPRDEIWVSGTLGDAAAGLALCQQGRAGKKEYEAQIIAHLAPEPRLDLARVLAECGKVHAMMDVSDGLATDLAHLCEQSNTGARIYADLLPVDKQLKKVAREMKKDFLSLVLRGGEDYQLLLTAPPEHRKDMEEISEQFGPLTHIGVMDEKGGVRLINGSPDQKELPEIDIGYSGYDHFDKILNP